MNMLPTGSDYSQLRAFLAVAETLSFTRAAENLGMTPSALSQTIRAFEESMGIQLLYRTTRSVSLTAAGENLLRRAEPLAKELAEAIGHLRQSPERPAGTVKVHCFRSAATKYIEPMLGSFHRAYPGVVLDITVDDTVVDVVAGGFDVALRIGEVIERDMIAVRLGPEMRQIPVASPDYIARRGRPEHPRDLLKHSCICWRWPGQARPYAWEFFEDNAWFEVAVDGPIIVNDKDMTVRAALQGIGIAFCVTDTVAEHLAEGSLVSLLEDWCEPFPGIFLCYPQQRQMAPALRAFIDAVRKAAR